MVVDVMLSIVVLWLVRQVLSHRAAHEATIVVFRKISTDMEDLRDR